MAGNIKVNTDIVVAAADSINTCNKNMYNGLAPVSTSISKMDMAWDGAAGANAVKAFNVLKSQYPDSRYNVVDNYVNFLLQQVGVGYTQTENANTSLADAFK